MISERLGKAALKRKVPRAKYIAFEHYSYALELYDEAEKIHPHDNQDAILRWNACLRTMQQFKLEAAPQDDSIQPFLDV